MKKGAEKWAHTQKGVTFTLDELNAFLENEWADLLLATFLDKNLQQDFQQLARYVAEETPEKVVLLLEKLKENRSNRETFLYLEESARAVLLKHQQSRPVKMNLLSKELEVFFSLLLLYAADRDPRVVEFDLTKEKRKPKRRAATDNDSASAAVAAALKTTKI